MNYYYMWSNLNLDMLTKLIVIIYAWIVLITITFMCVDITITFNLCLDSQWVHYYCSRNIHIGIFNLLNPHTINFIIDYMSTHKLNNLYGMFGTTPSLCHSPVYKKLGMLVSPINEIFLRHWDVILSFSRF
jgi:hypothetical protein